MLLETPLLSGSDLSRETDHVTTTLGSDSGEDSGEESGAEQDHEQTMARLKELLLKAKSSARATALAQQQKDELKNNDEVVLFAAEQDDDDDVAMPSSSKTRPFLPASLVRPLHLRAPTSSTLAAGDKGKGRETGITLAQDLAGVIESVGKEDKWGRAPMQSLSKKERKALHPHTAGPKWFNMPAQVMTPELKREVQAMRLRNALDPKRFYKGGAKDGKAMPEFFQLGHILPSTTSASNAVASIPRKRTFIEELVDDEQAKAYAKKKFVSEVMVRGMSGRGRSKKGGRGKGRGGKGRA